ncbi:hypothetical protein HU200_066969 [Digitaria exilis]|uniref:Uncharacterized protein n=1 Tax=Digitaria exilis TaxID=1010633 RepID=A0A834ZVR1_9POAL|nr:hypothetical protein HU200_066969 [Digitaria exilis]
MCRAPRLHHEARTSQPTMVASGPMNRIGGAWPRHEFRGRTQAGSPWAAQGANQVAAAQPSPRSTPIQATAHEPHASRWLRPEWPACPLPPAFPFVQYSASQKAFPSPRRRAQNPQTPSGAATHTHRTAHAHHATALPTPQSVRHQRVPMAKGGGEREGSALKTAVIVAGGLALAWVTVEAAFRPFLDRLRGAVSGSTDPARNPDQEEEEAPAPAATAAEAEEEKAPAPEEPSAPPAPEVVEEKVEEKVVELEEKVEEAAADDDKAE